MITKEQFEKAKLVINVKRNEFEDHYLMFIDMGFDKYKEIVMELERLNDGGKGYITTCIEDTKHPTLVRMRGRIIRDGKTGEDIEEDMDQEGIECAIDKTHQVADFYHYEDFEGWVNSL